LHSRPPPPTLFPYTTLFRSAEAMTDVEAIFLPSDVFLHLLEVGPRLSFVMLQKIAFELGESSNTVTVLAQKTVRERLAEILLLLDRKSTRLNSSHVKISYAV